METPRVNRGLLIFDGQVEIRQEIFWRIGAAALFGLGEVPKTLLGF